MRPVIRTPALPDVCFFYVDSYSLRVTPEVASVAPEPTRKTSPDDILTQKEAAELLGVSGQTLAYWRCVGKGPAYQKVGQRLIRYRRNDVLDWLAAGTVDPKDHGCPYLDDDE